MRKDFRRAEKYGMKNLEMNSDTYALRRKVIEMLYDLKKYVNLPRVEVRISTAGNNGEIGCGTLDHARIIWICQEATNYPYESLRHLVAHELGHAVKKLGHSDKCPVMQQGNSLKKPATLEQIIKVLK